MKKLRSLFLVLALGFGFMLDGGRAEGQIVGQEITFSVICQYPTNYLTTSNIQKNISGTPTNSTFTTNIEILTVLLDSANICKAIAVDLLQTNWTQYVSGTLWYEQNLATHDQGIFLRESGVTQTNVSCFFSNVFSTDAFSNYFSVTVPDVFLGMNFASNLPLGEITPATNTAGGDMVITTQTSLAGRFGNLAYLSFASSNIAFDLFGYNQSALVVAAAYSESNILYRTTNVEEGLIVGAGTFRLNVSTNIYDDPNYVVPPTNVYGIAHGTVYLSKPYYLSVLNLTNNGP